jgi:hypothetical protein
MARKLQSADEVFALLQAAAIAGERCPQSRPHGPIVDPSMTTRLAREGKIKVEIYAHNWRRVTILVGEHAGKATAGPPKAEWKPYKTFEKVSA